MLLLQSLYVLSARYLFLPDSLYSTELFYPPTIHFNLQASLLIAFLFFTAYPVIHGRYCLSPSLESTVSVFHNKENGRISSISVSHAFPQYGTSRLLSSFFVLLTDDRIQNSDLPFQRDLNSVVPLGYITITNNL